MLDGLLGRSGFYSKCKSLLKQTRTRIDVVKRKRNATQKFLRKDIADLLANGLDTNAFGRAEGFIAELIQSLCYEFIDYVCEIVLKHLPVLQKLRECPEDCREAVGSLMFAAARISDLPELRELRDVFQERYGSSLEYYVNPKLVENITVKPPSMEKKIKLMQEIATEFSIRWDSRSFEERMSNSAAAEKNKRPIHTTLPTPENKDRTPFAEEPVHRAVKDEVLMKKRSETMPRNKEREVDKHQTDMGREGTLGRGDDMKFNNVHRGSDLLRSATTPRNKERGVVDKESTIGRQDDMKYNVHRGPDLITDKQKPPSYREETIHKRDKHDISSRKGGPRFEQNESKENNTLEAESFPAKRGINSASTVHHQPAEDIQARTARNEDVPAAMNANARSAIPPPYVKPRKPKNKTEDLQDTLTFNPGGKSEKSQDPHQNGASAPENGDGPPRFTEIYYKDASAVDSPTRKRRSHRRKHSRSRSTKDNKLNGETGHEEERVVRRVSTSRRKHESRKGLPILFDDHHYKKDEEEKMIDKLLLHYSKKPSSSDAEKPRRKHNHHTNGSSKAPVHKTVDDNLDEENSTPTTSRSFSLPSRQVTEVEPQKKVFTRAASFQQETPANHVHPKLPDYDDLAARFAALRAGKD